MDVDHPAKVKSAANDGKLKELIKEVEKATAADPVEKVINAEKSEAAVKELVKQAKKEGSDPAVGVKKLLKEVAKT